MASRHCSMNPLQSRERKGAGEGKPSRDSLPPSAHACPIRKKTGWFTRLTWSMQRRVSKKNNNAVCATQEPGELESISDTLKTPQKFCIPRCQASHLMSPPPHFGVAVSAPACVYIAHLLNCLSHATWMKHGNKLLFVPTNPPKILHAP